MLSAILYINEGNIGIALKTKSFNSSKEGTHQINNMRSLKKKEIYNVIEV